MQQQQEYLYRLRPIRAAMITEGATDSERRIIRSHVAHLQRLADEGVVLLAGRTQTGAEDTFGLVIFKADSEDAARRIMESDPAIAGGVMSAELFPYAVAVVHRDWR